MSKTSLTAIPNERRKMVYVKKSTWKRLIMKKMEFDSGTMDKTISILLDRDEKK